MLLLFRPSAVVVADSPPRPSRVAIAARYRDIFLGRIIRDR